MSKNAKIRIYKTIIFSVFLHGNETWSVKHKTEGVREEGAGPNRDEVIEDWRKLHNEELHNLYSSPRTIRMIKSSRMRWVGHGE
jgi:hypothetical protein